MNLQDDLVGDFLSTFDTPAVVGDELLLIDLATAQTLLDIAEMTRDEERARKSVQLAREALYAPDQQFEKLEANEGLRENIEQSRYHLQVRLVRLERRWGLRPAMVDPVRSSA